MRHFRLRVRGHCFVGREGGLLHVRQRRFGLCGVDTLVDSASPAALSETDEAEPTPPLAKLRLHCHSGVHGPGQWARREREGLGRSTGGRQGIRGRSTAGSLGSEERGSPELSCWASWGLDSGGSWQCAGTTLVLHLLPHCFHTGVAMIPLVLHRYCTGTALVLHPYYAGAVLLSSALHWQCAGSAVELG